MRRTAAVVVLALACTAAPAVLLGPAPPASQAKIDAVMAWVEQLEPTLTAQPYLLPPAPADSLDVAVILMHADATAFEIYVEPVRAIEGSLRVDREQASRVRSVPDYWLFVLQPDGAVVYWVPLESPRLVRVEAPGSGGVVQLKDGFTSARIPFVRQGIVAVIATRGGWKVAGPSAIAKLGGVLQ